ncbi:uncharacterized protein LOC113566856 [Drosophila persimilis]|uniref:uncharacterized protein LOC113566856 n=1 Tax=Drosophila persimilis TaxID=7234 RepID=UPI000F086E14|nr:uncharacterized protein LOC113566856 [Drosophila persimilis]
MTKEEYQTKEQNLVVRQTLWELPISCPSCNDQFSDRKDLSRHLEFVCEGRVVCCKYHCVGCSWKGPYKDSVSHDSDCGFPQKQGKEILDMLHVEDRELEAQKPVLQLHRVLSASRVEFFTLRMKWIHRSEGFGEPELVCSIPLMISYPDPHSRFVPLWRIGCCVYMPQSVCSAKQLHDIRPRIYRHIFDSTGKCAKRQELPLAGPQALYRLFAMTRIQLRFGRLLDLLVHSKTFFSSSVGLIMEVTAVLAVAIFNKTRACCPSCRSLIRNYDQEQNLVVRQTLWELPISCPSCNDQFSDRKDLSRHLEFVCEGRVVCCKYHCVGCSWKGPYKDSVSHDSDCGFPQKQGKEILDMLHVEDRELEAQKPVLQLHRVLSASRVEFFTLRMKWIHRSEGFGEPELVCSIPLMISYPDPHSRFVPLRRIGCCVYMPQSVCSAKQLHDIRPRIYRHIFDSTGKCAKRQELPLAGPQALYRLFAMTRIQLRFGRLLDLLVHSKTFFSSSVGLIMEVTAVLAVAIFNKTRACCPSCRSLIRNYDQEQNLVVRQTLWELPISCPSCNDQFSDRKDLSRHLEFVCEGRVVCCKYHCVGCSWKGPYKDSVSHDSDCGFPQKQGKEILDMLHVEDRELEAQKPVLQLHRVLSASRVEFFTLRMKWIHRSEGFGEPELVCSIPLMISYPDPHSRFVPLRRIGCCVYMPQSVCSAKQLHDIRPRIYRHIFDSTGKCAKRQELPLAGPQALYRLFAMTRIQLRFGRLLDLLVHSKTFFSSSVGLIMEVTAVLAVAIFNKTRACCPSCRSLIRNYDQEQNLVVRQTLWELPISCPSCNDQFSDRKDLSRHLEFVCEGRVVCCKYHCVGCSWKGPYKDSVSHDSDCGFPQKQGKEILDMLHVEDRELEAQKPVLQLHRVLSASRVEFFTLRMKWIHRSEGFGEPELVCSIPLMISYPDPHSRFVPLRRIGCCVYMPQSVCSAKQLHDIRPRIYRHIFDSTGKCAKRQELPLAGPQALYRLFAMTRIQLRFGRLLDLLVHSKTFFSSSVGLIMEVTAVLAVAIFNKTRACCPSCRSLIRNYDQEQNLVVRQTLWELPISCPSCNDQFSDRKDLSRHLEFVCEGRVVCCKYHCVGCSWKGSYKDSVSHDSDCGFPQKQGKEILDMLHVEDRELEAQKPVLQLHRVLSASRVEFFTLRMKWIHRSEGFGEPELVCSIPLMISYPDPHSRFVPLRRIGCCVYMPQSVCSAKQLHDIRPRIYRHIFDSTGKCAKRQELPLAGPQALYRLFAMTRIQLRLWMFLHY